MGSFNRVRDAVETGGTLAGNYLLPGSSLLTSHLVSNGSQDQLGSTLGRVAQLATGAAGSGVGSSFTGIPSASSIGAGWTNAANGVGNLVGAGDLGTNIANGVSSATDSLSSALKNGASAIGNAIGLSSGGDATPILTAAGNALSSPTGTNTDLTSVLSGDFSPSASAAAPGASAFTPAASSFSPSSNLTALNIGSGGGTSSFNGGGLGLTGALLGGANSLYANNQAQKALIDSQNKANAALAPYLKSGTATNAALSDALGTSGNTSAPGYGTLGKAFTPGDLTQDPGYQFELNQGDLALDRKNAASGNYFSGAALKGAQDYGQGLATTTYNNAYQRYLQQQQQQYGMLAGQSGAGQGAAGTIGGIDSNIGSAQAGAGVSSSNILNQTLSSLLNGNGRSANGIVAIDPLTGKPRIGNAGVTL